MNNIFEQALLGLLLKQVAVVEIHQNAALTGKKNDLQSHLVSLGNLLTIVEGCNELELSDITASTISEYVVRFKMESLLNKTVNNEG